MKIKALNVVSAGSFVALTQLLFFWLISPQSETFLAVYPFYTAITLAHTLLISFLCTKYQYPANFAPVFGGSLVTVGEIVAGLFLGTLCTSLRTIVFVQAIIVVMYVLVMAFFCSVASRESVDSTVPREPVRPYGTNAEAVLVSPPAIPATPELPRRRMPKIAPDRTNR